MNCKPYITKQNPYGMEEGVFPYPEACVFFVVTGKNAHDNYWNFDKVAIVVAPTAQVAKDAVRFDAYMSKDGEHSVIGCIPLTSRAASLWPMIHSRMEEVRDGRSPPLPLTDATTFCRVIRAAPEPTRIHIQADQDTITVAAKRAFDMGATLWIAERPIEMQPLRPNGFLPRLERILTSAKRACA